MLIDDKESMMFKAMIKSEVIAFGKKILAKIGLFQSTFPDRCG